MTGEHDRQPARPSAPPKWTIRARIALEEPGLKEPGLPTPRSRRRGRFELSEEERERRARLRYGWVGD